MIEKKHTAAAVSTSQSYLQSCDLLYKVARDSRGEGDFPPASKWRILGLLWTGYSVICMLLKAEFHFSCFKTTIASASLAINLSCLP